MSAVYSFFLPNDLEERQGSQQGWWEAHACLFSPSSGRVWEYYEFSPQSRWRERRELEVLQSPPNLLVDTGQAAENQGVCLSKWLSPRGVFLFIFHLSSLASLRFKLFLRVSNAAAVQSISHVWLFAIPWTAARQAPVASTISQSLRKSMSIESGMPSNQLTLRHTLLL